MSKKNVITLESSKLSKNLLLISKKNQKIKNKIKSLPKWLLGRETLYEPKK
tara:strand:+ start:263 stop:415 length:153 start_codon:yes stop_codon:yes gene_type:complete